MSLAVTDSHETVNSIYNQSLTCFRRGGGGGGGGGNFIAVDIVLGSGTSLLNIAIFSVTFISFKIAYLKIKTKVVLLLREELITCH